MEEGHSAEVWWSALEIDKAVDMSGAPKPTVDRGEHQRGLLLPCIKGRGECKQNLVARAHKKADAIQKAEEYRLKAQQLEVDLKKAKDYAVEQLKQKDLEHAEQK
nr:uncharacterized protein LOC117852129 [Setaria viridis]